MDNYLLDLRAILRAETQSAHTVRGTTPRSFYANLQKHNDSTLRFFHAGLCVHNCPPGQLSDTRSIPMEAHREQVSVSLHAENLRCYVTCVLTSGYMMRRYSAARGKSMSRRRNSSSLRPEICITSCRLERRGHINLFTYL